MLTNESYCYLLKRCGEDRFQQPDLHAPFPADHLYLSVSVRRHPSKRLHTVMLRQKALKHRTILPVNTDCYTVLFQVVIYPCRAALFIAISELHHRHLRFTYKKLKPFLRQQKMVRIQSPFDASRRA